MCVNLNNEPDNRKSSKQCLLDLNPNIGSFPANSSRLSGLMIQMVHMSYKALFQKTYDLVKWVYPTVNKFPRNRRLVLSQRIEVTSIRILELVIDLSQRNTEANRRKILYEIHKLQILFRLCKDLSYLSFRKYEHVSSLLDEVSTVLDTVGGGTGHGLRKFVR